LLLGIPMESFPFFFKSFFVTPVPISLQQKPFWLIVRIDNI